MNEPNQTKEFSLPGLFLDLFHENDKNVNNKEINNYLLHPQSVGPILFRISDFNFFMFHANDRL